MNPFYSIDLTLNKKNEERNGKEFLNTVPSPALAQALQQSAGKAEATEEAAKLPTALRIVQFISGIVAMIFFISILKADVSLAQGYRNAPWVFWTAPICAVVWAILKLLSMAKAKSVLGAEENSRVFSNYARIADSVYAELAVPANAKEADILWFYYKVKDGDIRVCEKGMQITQYFNPEFQAFSDSEKLYLVNLDGKYDFPLSSITRIRTVKKHIRIAGWNKQEKFDKGIYKPYKLTADNYGCIHCKCYHILEVRHNAEEYGIYIPSYELPVFEALTGLKASVGD